MGNQVTTVERPAPAVGQRWKVTTNAGGAAWTGKEFTISHPYPNGGGWCHTPGSNMYWPDGSFTNGDLIYLGGPTVAAPMSAAGVCGPWRDNNLNVSPDFACCLCECRADAHPGYVAPAKPMRFRSGATAASTRAVEPAVGHATTRARCNTDGCDVAPAHVRVNLCETHIAEAMVFSDGCRLKPDLFPASKPPGRFQQSHAGGFVGLWSLRDEGAK